MQAQSQLCYTAAVWERSANPAANVGSTETPPAAGAGKEGLVVPAMGRVAAR